jgi:transcriptional regulator with XRE-family HTH domain
MINRNFVPLRGRPSAKAKGLRHRNDAAELAGGLEDDRIPFAHDATYSTAKQRTSSPAIPFTKAATGQLGMATLGSRMKAVRKRAKKTQQQVADELDVTKGAVSQWENDQTVPELEYFVGFCVYTNASADELLLHREMDQLLRQLIEIWKRLTTDGRDELLGKANRILAEEHPEPGPHNPFPSKPLNPPKTGQKTRS